MHSALWEQLMEIGPGNTIDPDVCRKCKTTPPVVALVLMEAVTNTNTRSEFFRSAATEVDRI